MRGFSRKWNQGAAGRASKLESLQWLTESLNCHNSCRNQYDRVLGKLFPMVHLHSIELLRISTRRLFFCPPFRQHWLISHSDFSVRMTLCQAYVKFNFPKDSHRRRPSDASASSSFCAQTCTQCKLISEVTHTYAPQRLRQTVIYCASSDVLTSVAATAGLL